MKNSLEPCECSASKMVVMGRGEGSGVNSERSDANCNVGVSYQEEHSQWDGGNNYVSSSE